MAFIETENIKLELAVKDAVGGRKVKNLSWKADDLNLIDFHRFFSLGDVRYSIVEVNPDWGLYFKEAVIVYKEFVVVVQKEEFEEGYNYIFYHEDEDAIKKLWDEFNEWWNKNTIFKNQEFTFPKIRKPKVSDSCFIDISTRKEIEENTVLFLKNLDEIRKNGLKTKRGIILYGKPGNGKTSICRWVSKKLDGITRIWLTDWYFSSPEKISDLFSLARKLSPTIIFMEDIDTSGVSRYGTGVINPLLGKLLNEMDGIEDNDGVIVVATTNNIYALDRALMHRPGRFDMKIHINNPLQSTVKEITGKKANITLAEAFRRKEDQIYYEKILGKKYVVESKRHRVPYIG